MVWTGGGYSLKGLPVCGGGGFDWVVFGGSSYKHNAILSGIVGVIGGGRWVGW